MVPVIESRVALDFLVSYSRDRRIETSITRMGQRVRDIVPQTTALSLGLVEEGLTFTLVAETRELALLDAIQYLDGGPCAAALARGEVTELAQPATNEHQWHLFALAQSVAGVASTLSLPIMSGGRVVCGVDLYAFTPDAFDGLHDELATACWATAQGAVTNADLSFTSRLRAAAAPARLRERSFVDSATGFVAAQQDVDLETAATRIRDAAARAGVRQDDVARFILDSHPAIGG